MRKLIFAGLLVFVAGCVETSVQPLTQSSFKISTEAEDLCGAKGTREIAFREAAIEVIKRGADRFVVVGDQSKTEITGGMFTTYGGFDTYGTNTQDMVIQIIQKGDPRINDSLSARQTLGADWQAIVAKGSADSCI
ncbi:MAG: hypothetical protein U1E06_04790 [Tabrizicola sp.]|uniref:hypothetical protein n=1 Tax=Tabrizicola sp. TaxID=2005166 RepID=UPI002732D6DA|nr:hypothetical protein [Tabrizicola sp.]MDP3264315.1 hypothetical protein [Tabrizicola sp.]MDP3648640.1 hypothetical protein [Paracoccaceae bacterium]MDZ4066156.1 hypothetical protein [Tabrizicola sp.]